MLHRTKCSKTKTEVVSPAIQEDLKLDLDGQKYCVFLDESTDVMSSKNLCIAVSFFGQKNNGLKIAYLSYL